MHFCLCESKKQEINQSLCSFTVITSQQQFVYKVLRNFYDTLKLIQTDKHQSPPLES